MVEITPEVRWKLILIGGVGALTLALDQLTKWWVVSSLEVLDPHVIIPKVFDIERHPGNPGAAFGLFSNIPDGMRVPFFVVAAIIAVGVVIYFGRTTEERLSLVSLGMVLGGALGNLVDRVARDGLVVDFIHTRWDGVFDYPFYNVADIGITAGVALLLFDSFVLQRRRKQHATKKQKPKKKRDR